MGCGSAVTPFGITLGAVCMGGSLLGRGGAEPMLKLDVRDLR